MRPRVLTAVSAFLEIDRLSKRFGDLRVLDRVSLSVEEGEVLALLGPSGSGKTTFLRLLAGFETPDEGAIRAGGRRMETLPPARRGFGMVFQHYALFPHLTVRSNVAFGLETTGTPRAETDVRVAEVLALVDLEGFGERRIEELSGGQQQRVALARALAPHPRLLLLDEPLSNLDPELRERTRRELLEAIRRVGITTVLVTHEQEEAFYLGNRVAVLWHGRLQQVGSPEELYLEPSNPFVARFIGRSSTLPGRIDAVAPDGRCRVRLSVPGEAGMADSGTETPGPTAASGRAGADPPQAREPVWQAVLPEELRDGGRSPAPGDAVELVVRPEALRLGRRGDGPAPAGSLAGRVILRRYGGPVTYYRVVLDEGEGAEEDGGPGPGASAPEAGPPAVGPELEVLAGADDAAEGEAVWIEPAGAGPEPRAFPVSGPGRGSARNGGAGDREPEASP